MNILIVAATVFEVNRIAPQALSQGLPMKLALSGFHQADVLITGIGAVQTAFHIARFANNYDLILNVGIAGSFNQTIAIGDVVMLSQDCFGDYGIDDNGKFVTLRQAGLLSETESSTDDLMFNPWANKISLSPKLKPCKGVTVGTASGSKAVIDNLVKTWNPDIETMESAAVFYACLNLNKPFLCIRAISNYVEPRNRLNWRISQAINNLNDCILNIINEPNVSNLKI